MNISKPDRRAYALDCCKGLYRGVLPNVQRAALVNLGELGARVFLTPVSTLS